MASRPDAPSSRHVGKIVDPLAREDGELEPDFSEQRPSEGRESIDEASGEGGAGDEASGSRGAKVRERLLLRAEEARRDVEPVEPAPGDDLDEIGRRATELAKSGDDPATRRAPGAPAQRSQLSPTVVALFGTLMGMAVVASVAAIAMRLSPREREPVQAPSSVPAVAPAPVAAAPAPKPKKRQRQHLPGPYRVAEGANDPALRLIDGKVGTEPFIRALGTAGVPEKETYRVVTAFQGIRSFDRCKKSDRFMALLDRQTKRMKAFEYLVSAEEVYQAREGADGLLTGTKLDLKVERTQIAGALVYDGKSLDDSAEQAGFERGLGRVILSALDGHASEEDLSRGDVIRLVVQEVTALGDFARYAGVEALELRPVKGEPLRVYYFDMPGERGYYDVKGRAPHDGGWRKPIPGAPITSRFNLKRMHPVLKKIMPHLGTDFGAPSGTPIGASAPGTVTFVGYSGPAGNLVKIAHPGGVETGYAHLSRFADGIKIGAKVKRMELVGYVGSTGRSTGPHLHFSASKNKEFFDAEKLNLDAMRTLAGDHRAALDTVIVKYNALLDAIVLPEPLAEEIVAAPATSSSSVALAAPRLPEPKEEEEETAPPPPPLAAPPSSNAPTRAGSSIYLTDEELRKIQGATD
ncbi:MAG TPA: M23 family metallopeptidase, partial [Polyangiaceae bacterium]|nr:M23 family metallopeptidase [Polyangiaceae bacterium]